CRIQQFPPARMTRTRLGKYCTIAALLACAAPSSRKATFRLAGPRQLQSSILRNLGGRGSATARSARGAIPFQGSKCPVPGPGSLARASDPGATGPIVRGLRTDYACRMAKRKFQWHPLFARLLRPRLEGYYEVQTGGRSAICQARRTLCCYAVLARAPCPFRGSGAG